MQVLKICGTQFGKIGNNFPTLSIIMMQILGTSKVCHTLLSVQDSLAVMSASASADILLFMRASESAKF